MPTTEALLRQFCSDFAIPDLSPLANPVLGEYDACGILWGLVQAKLSLEKQREFLRDVCTNSGVPTLCFLLSLITEEATEMQCNSSFGIIRMTPNLAPTLSERIHDLCRTNLPCVAALMNRQNIEDVVYSIDRIVSVADERMLRALDELKFQANPNRFAGMEVHDTKDWAVFYTSRMKLYDEEIAVLSATELGLERQLTESPPSTPKTPCGGFTAGGGASTWGDRTVPGPNGHHYRRRRGPGPSGSN